MDLKQTILSARTALDRVEKTPDQLKMLLGFDGFVDEIIDVVDKRENFEKYSKVETIKAFAERLDRAAGLSTNVELVPRQVKLGGNGPIMANALLSYGAQVTYVGAVGYPNIHPVFEDMASKTVETISIAEPGHTDACEFNDGKIMLGKTITMSDITWENICERVGLDRFKDIVASSELVAFVNWTMIPYMTNIWEHMLAEVLPGINYDKKPIAFFDLADPEKRKNEDIVAAMETIKKFNNYTRAVLGLNRKEASEIAAVLGLELSDAPDKVSLQEITEAIGKAMNIYGVVVHPTNSAACYIGGQYYSVDGPFTSKPKLTTGAGDNFNAGFSLGLTLGLDPKSALVMGVGTSGFYVRNMHSPSFSDLKGFLELWAENAGKDF